MKRKGKRAKELKEKIEKEEDKDRSRPYGGFSYMTKRMKRRLDSLLSKTQEERRRDLRKTKEMLLELKEQARRNPYVHKEGSPEHVKELMSRWDISFFYLLAYKAISNMEEGECDVLQATEFWEEIFETGIKNTPGYRTRNGLWGDVEAEKLEKKIREMKAAKDKGRGAFKQRKTAWYDGLAAEMMVTAVEKEIKNGRWYKVPEERIPGEQDPVLGFPKHEPKPEDPEKRRLCVDKRAPNALEVVMDQVQIPGALATVEAMEYAATGGTMPFLTQTKKHFTEEMAQEIQLRDASEEAEKYIEEIKEKARKTGTKEKKILWISGRDIRSYYYQFAVARPLSNMVTVVGPSDPSGARETITVASKCALFGSLSSIAGCIGMSEWLNAILTDALGILATIYIDDITTMEEKELLKEATEIVDLLLELLRLEKADEKTTSMEGEDGEAKEAVTMLGLEYIMGQDEIRIQIPQRKRDKAVDRLEHLMEAINKGQLEEKMLLKAIGSARWAAQLSRQLRGLLRELDRFNLCRTWGPSNRIVRRRMLSTVRSVIRAIRDNPGITIYKRTTELTHSYSDASKEEDGIALAGYKGNQLWKLAITPERIQEEIPRWMKPIHINMLETVALVANEYRYTGRGEHNIAHVDNTGAGYWVIGGSAPHLGVQAIITWYLRWASAEQCYTHLTWIASTRNITADSATREERWKELVAAKPEIQTTELRWEDLLPWTEIHEIYIQLQRRNLEDGGIGNEEL